MAAKRSLVVVESPTKVKTIQKYLDSKYIVKASMGHVRDLPKSQLGVDPKKNFKPKYVVSPAKKKILDDLKKAAEKVEALYVATDPDREGEAIGWHLAEELGVAKKNVYRITFNEITERAVKAAFTQPGKIDLKKVDAQQARRVLDRLVGYSLSPLLWEKVQRGLSAGRVQSVAVRLIVDREREIKAFVPVEYWSLHARLKAARPPEFVATLKEVAGEKASLGNEEVTRALMASLEGARFVVKSVTRGERRRNPAPPFITSTLQQEAGKKLGFTARKTMTIAQQLYEGIDLGSEGAEGLITYMRTDSVRVAREAQAAARGWVIARIGDDYVPEAPPTYRSRGSAQEAHEAIRPSELRNEPRAVAQFLTKDQMALYRLIWERFLASQMMPAVYDTVGADIEAGQCVFRAQGATLKFKGFTAVYEESRDEEDAQPEQEPEGQVPPLEELGIGRPSTYASILGTIINDRGYVHRERRTLSPTELGMAVTDKLIPYFQDIMNVEFTAQMEDNLDKIEEGQRKWVDTVREFYEPFKRDLARAKREMQSEKVGAPTGETCPECGSELLEKRGRFGKFLACSSYPDCRYTRNLDGSGRAEDEPANENCPTCGKPMVIKHGRFGKFIACSGYPECKTTKPVTLGIACPETGCTGQLVERRSRKGRTFFGCSAYPNCKFVVWRRPVNEPCPQCGAACVTERVLKNRTVRSCAREGCDFEREVELPVT